MIKNVGFARLIKATGYSVAGLQAAFRSEAAFRQELALFFLFVALAFYLDVTTAERALLIGSLFLVLIVEILNSAFEATIDRISTERHELSKRVKDLGSAAVFLSLLNMIAIWAIVLIA